MAHVRSLFFDGPLAEVENKALTAYKLGRPSEIIWNITDRCNLLCDHCYMAADGHVREDQLSDEDTIALVRQMGEAGVPLVFLTGGEPLLRANFWEILREARAQDMQVTVSTNATMIDADVARSLRSYGVDYIATSLYGPADFHDAMVGVPGTRDAVVEAIRVLRAEGVGVAIKSAVSRDTWPHVYDLIQEAKDLDAGLIYLCDLITSGRSEGEEDGRITSAEWRELADFILEDMLDEESRLEYDIGALPSVIPYLAEKLLERGYDISRALERLTIMSACPVGKGHMSINSEGGIMPCQFAQDWTVGNVRDMTLDEAVRELFELDVAAPSGQCGPCEYSRICRGCRTKAFHEFDDPMGEDTTCILHAEHDSAPLREAVSAAGSAGAPCAMGGCS
jgi:radical SAM protein with 4Fe4S-binding SPASM domain